MKRKKYQETRRKELFYVTSGSNVMHDVHWCVTVDHQQSRGDFCLRMREQVKKTFCFRTFVNALLERAVFGAAKFDNRTFEGESFFNRSSVSHLKHVTVKSNSK